MFAQRGVRRQIAGLLLLFGLTMLLGVTLVMPNRVNAQTSPTLGTAASFAVIGGETVTNTGPTVVNGDLGVSPGSAATGFPPGIVTPPAMIFAGDGVALQAQNDATAAYNNLAGQTPCTDLSGQDLGSGATPPLPLLTSGIYCFSSSAQVIGTLTLDGGGVFIFQIGSTLTTASGSAVVVANGTSDCNVWWQVGSSATLGTTTSFAGNILALTSITLTTGASVSGRAFAQTGAVTLDSNTIGSSACIPAPPPRLSLTKNDGGGNASPGFTIIYTLNFQNTGGVTLDNVTLTDAVPAGTTFNAGASTPGWDCTGSPCTFNVGTLLPGASGSAVFAVTVNNDNNNESVGNSATITSGATTATATETTRVIRDGDDDDDDDSGGQPAATAVPTQTLPSLATFTPDTVQPISSSQGVSGLPNTGGGPPDPAYWPREQRQ